MVKQAQPLAVFDIDGTLFRSSLTLESLNTLIKEGLIPATVRKEYEAEYQAWQNRQGSYMDYVEKAVETYINQMTGIEKREFDAVISQMIEDQWQHTYRHTRQLIKQLQQTHFLLAISLSPDHILEPFAKNHGFDAVIGSIYEVENGIYTGEAYKSHSSKERAVKEAMEQYNFTLNESIGVGDTENDIDFLKLVEQPIAFNPNRALFQQAKDHSWKIVIERKNMIYHLAPDETGEYKLEETSAHPEITD